MASFSDNSVEEFYNSLANGYYKSIVVVLGAGVSVSAGIPDFRSPGGLFEAVKNHFGEKFPEIMKQPEKLLSRKFCNENPDVWKNEVVPMLRSWKLEETNPTITHKMLGWLHKQGWLKRVYTQNIDGLELHQDVILETQDSSGYKDCIIQSHGSMRDGSVVLYGDTLPEYFYKSCELDFKYSDSPVDLLLVMGTSLQVAPFCAIPNLAPKGATRVLVDPFPNRVISLNPWTQAKTELGGRQVELCSLWRKKEPLWENELLIESTSDNFTQRFFESPISIKKGFSLLSYKPEKVEVISKGEWHICDIISKNNDMLKVKRCKDGKMAEVSIKKTKIFRSNLE
jgi:NAD-dependent SIR2 family protein deacetylase